MWSFGKSSRTKSSSYKIPNASKYSFIIVLGDPRGTAGRKIKCAKIKEVGELECLEQDSENMYKFLS